METQIHSSLRNKIVNHYNTVYDDNRKVTEIVKIVMFVNVIKVTWTDDTTSTVFTKRLFRQYP